MIEKYGVDVSHHNGSIDWNKASPYISFVMIRAGYGQGNVDDRFLENVTALKKLGIPFGIYWFSYALTPEMAIQEADYAIDLIEKYNFKLDYPIAYDYEYASEEFAKRKGYNVSADDIEAMARAFLDRVKERGYMPMLYANPDYIARYYMNIKRRYDLWIAQWGNEKPVNDCAIWQKSSKHTIPGFSGYVDYNVCYEDYPKDTETEDTNETLDNMIWYLEYCLNKLKAWRDS